MSKDRTWLGAQVAAYKLSLPHYRRYAEVLESFMKRAAGELALNTIVQSRPKSIASFAEKAWRKRHKYNNPLHQFTDLCGARVICRTRSDAEAMGRLVERTLEIDWENSVDCGSRLKPTEFGYRSVHYIVTLRSTGIPGYDLEIPEEVVAKAAEVQIRTVAEHAYADIAHDLTHKGAFQLPTSWERELAGVAASLEEADQTVSRIEEKLSHFAANYGVLLSKEELETEIENLGIVLEFDPKNEELAVRLSKLYHIAGDWDKAEETLTRFLLTDHPERTPRPVLRELGVTLCKRFAPGSKDHAQGQRYLEIASGPDFRDVDAMCSLAGSWRTIDEEKARELYQRAFEVDPYNTYALGNYIEQELLHNPGILGVARPLLIQAIERCRAHADARVNLPWAYYDLGKFYLLLNEPYKALDAYAKGLSVSEAPFMVETSLQSVQRLGGARVQILGCEWIRRLLIIGLASRFSSPERTEAVCQLATEGVGPLQGPVLIVAGGTDPQLEDQIRSYSGLLPKALVSFRGTIIAGGTTQGVSGLAGDVAQIFPGRVYCLGYLPARLPSDATTDDDRSRYTEIRHTVGQGFTPLEPLQAWIDLLASGLIPEQVRVLGINGGIIAGAEYRIALAVGAKVGILEGSGRESWHILADADWLGSERLVQLPADSAVVGAFAALEPPNMPPQLLESVARAIHEEYRRERLSSRQLNEAALADWEELSLDLQNSNRDQAHRLQAKLEAVGYTFSQSHLGAGGTEEFSEEESETMARLEHGRWVVERLVGGWRLGKDRDPEKKTHPHLVGWTDLPEAVKDLDRQTVRTIPQILKAQGFRILRVP